MKLFSCAVVLLLATTAASNAQEGNFHLDKDYTMSATGTVKLIASDAKVTITGSVRNTAHVKIDREVMTKGVTLGHEEFSVDVVEENGNLSIREHSNSFSVGMIGYRNEKYTIVLELPQGSALSIKGDDGNYYIKNINGSIKADLDDADVELMACSGDRFEFRLDDGDLKMDQGKGSFFLDADDADVDISKASFSVIDASLDDGDFVIETILTDHGDYRIRAQDGLVAMTVTGGGGKFDIRHDDGNVSIQGDFNVEEDSENYTRMTLASGTAKVDIRTDDARVKLIRR